MTARPAVGHQLRSRPPRTPLGGRDTWASVGDVRRKSRRLDRGKPPMDAPGFAPPWRRSTTGGGDATGEGNAEPMENETRLERWLDRAIARAETPRGGATVIATITTIATVAFGLLMTAIDHKNFTTLGQGLWW